MAQNDNPRLTGLRVAKVLVWLVYAYFIVALIILTLAFFLQLFNASATAEFTQWVYRSADRVLEPFRGIFPTKELGTGGSVIDFAVLFAIVMYGIFALVVHAFITWIDGKIITLQAAQAEADRSTGDDASGPGPAVSPSAPGAATTPGAQ